MTTAIVEARGVQRIRAFIDHHEERPADRIRRENRAALAEMEALGNGPNSAMLVARRMSNDPHTRAILAQRFRRLRRRKLGTTIPAMQ
ncbi:hypothetical protein ACVWYH_003095 [Bradyrhizobium sp. GM24.11]